jgi:hypothetical protein
MRPLVASILLLCAALAGGLQARAEGLVLVELFASKNCPACPAAHRNMADIAALRSDLLILTWSVDYWDYLGGKDPLALPESKHRQRGYVERFSLRGPYTPQAVVAGSEHAAGNRRARVIAGIAKAAALAPAPVTLTRQGRWAQLDGDPGRLADIWWVSYVSGAANASDLVNPVTSAHRIGSWLGGAAQIELPACESRCALIVQEAGFGRVLAVLEAR